MPDFPIRRIILGEPDKEDDEKLRREWLATNGIGGYASATVGGGLSRRYHGLLIAALPAPLGRVVMFNHLAEFVRLRDSRRIALQPDAAGNTGCLREFTLEDRMPTWRYACEGATILKRLALVHGQNTVQITYTLQSDRDDLRIELHPSVQFRRHESDTTEAVLHYTVCLDARRCEITAKGTSFPILKLIPQGHLDGFVHTGSEIREMSYAVESDRGYASRGFLWNPGFFLCVLRRDHDLSLTASTESWDVIDALPPPAGGELELERCRHLLQLAEIKSDETRADLVLAADQFIIAPVGRVVDGARARAVGDEVRTIIAGYHWFTDWGRDTMISLEGLTLSTGRAVEAGWILRTFSHYVRDGLIPNLFPEGKNAGLYHTADATLWFFHAVDRYVEATGDRSTLRYILPRFRDIVEHHVRGTHFNIRMDSGDSLLAQGEKGYQLTWMDAKMGDWVVTPRRGKAVEINALWYNALRMLEMWSREEGDETEAAELGSLADAARRSFNLRFWNESAGYLYDVVDGDEGNDPACRPNQIFSISLRFPALDQPRWESVLAAVRDQLLTPYGLRSLSPGDPNYKPRYFGDLRARDAAYHQGTVWAWLIGPFIDAWLKVHPAGQSEARAFLDKLIEHLNQAGIGSISEVFDAEPPYTPRGCIAQAWSVAEVLRSWVKTGPPPSREDPVGPGQAGKKTAAG